MWIVQLGTVTCKGYIAVPRGCQRRGLREFVVVRARLEYIYTSALFSGAVLASSFVLLPVTYHRNAYLISLLPPRRGLYHIHPHSISSQPTPVQHSFLPTPCGVLSSEPFVLSSPELFDSWSGLSKRSFASASAGGDGVVERLGVCGFWVRGWVEGGLGGMGCANGDRAVCVCVWGGVSG